MDFFFFGTWMQMDFLDSAASYCLVFAIFQSSVLYFRGQRIWDAIITDLLQKGLAKAKNVFSAQISIVFSRYKFGVHLFYAFKSCICFLQVLLSGCSAGGLATFFHCDSLKERLGGATTVKCLSDAGFFLDL